jgi:group I intron endonuclease
MFIYKITCKKNNKVYVGLTNETIKKRFSRHQNDARLGSNMILHAAMRKHGIENFTVEHVATAKTYDELVMLEKHYIQKFQSYIRTNKGYNCTLGGEGSDSPKINSKYGRGKKRPKAHGLKISKALKGKPATGKNAIGVTNKLNKPVCARKIGTQDILTFASAKIAANHLQIKTYGHINSVCKNKRLSTSGWVFWYLSDSPKLQDSNTFTRKLFGKLVTQGSRWRHESVSLEQ